MLPLGEALDQIATTDTFWTWTWEKMCKVELGAVEVSKQGRHKKVLMVPITRWRGPSGWNRGMIVSDPR